MSTTPHRSPEPWDDAFGILASGGEPATSPTYCEPGEAEADDGAEWSGAPGDGTEWSEAHATSDEPTWHAEPAADDEWYDDAVVTPNAGTLYASGPGMPTRGVLVTTGTAVAACAALDFALTGSAGFFFDLCFAVICLVVAMAAAPQALFTVAVMPPLVFSVLIATIGVLAPETIADASYTTVFLTGLADHAAPLCVAYGVALLVASARGLAHRSSRRP
jgi:hypothetical protein